MTTSSLVEDVGLLYVTYTQPGISRVRSGSGFRYIDPTGKAITSAEVLSRIQKLVIPPAWSEVWICPVANGHLQAVGRDARGRRQYLYHPLWRAGHDAAKFGELLNVARVLPALRRRVAQDLADHQLSRQKVLAIVVRLLETTLIRVGNEEYARENHSYGLTTFEDRHAIVDGAKIRFEFRGKSGKDHVVDVDDVRLARIVQQCQDLPGQRLFQYDDASGARHHIASEDVNAYLYVIGGHNFTAKDFRTWMATVSALEILRKAGPPTSPILAQRTVVNCMRTVAGLLGNTPAICRKSYVHPGVIQKYTSGELDELCRGHTGVVSLGLTAAEYVAVGFLQRLSERN